MIRLVSSGPGRPDGRSDEELVQQVLAGDPALFELLMRRHNQRVYRAIRAVLKAEAEVEDAMQQAYLQAYAHLASFNGTAKFSTWLLRIAVNEALLRIRKERHLAAVAEDALEFPMSRSISPDERASARELTRAVESAVDRLPPVYRGVFVLREIDGLNTAEAAEVLGVSEDVVKTRLHRAKEQLRSDLEQRLGESTRSAFRFEAPRCDRVVEAVMAKITGQRDGANTIQDHREVDARVEAHPPRERARAPADHRCPRRSAAPPKVPPCRGATRPVRVTSADAGTSTPLGARARAPRRDLGDSRAMNALSRTRLLLPIVAALLLAGCKEQPASDGAAAAAEDGGYDPCSPERLKLMKPYMECLIAPFGSMGRGDEESFRKALEEVRGMVPDVQYAQPGDPNNWITIVDQMLETRQYKAGCKRCHNAWRADFKRRYRDAPIR